MIAVAPQDLTDADREARAAMARAQEAAAAAEVARQARLAAAARRG